MLTYQQLKDILPQAYPFLLIDRVEEIKEGESLVAIKNITVNEWACMGYSSEGDVFPQTLLIEAAAQTAMVLYNISMVEEGEKRPQYVLGKVKVEFSEFVSVGDQIRIKAHATKMVKTGGVSDIELFVNSQKVADMFLFFSVRR